MLFEKTKIVCHHAKNPIKNRKNPLDALVHSSSTLLVHLKLIRIFFLWDEKRRNNNHFVPRYKCVTILVGLP